MSNAPTRCRGSSVALAHRAGIADSGAIAPPDAVSCRRGFPPPVLRHRGFALLFFSLLFSNTGTWMAQTGPELAGIRNDRFRARARHRLRRVCHTNDRPAVLWRRPGGPHGQAQGYLVYAERGRAAISCDGGPGGYRLDSGLARHSHQLYVGGRTGIRPAHPASHHSRPGAAGPSSGPP